MDHASDIRQQQLDNTFEITKDSLSDGIERRQYNRRAASWPASITTRDKIVIQCKTSDISEQGASISSSHDFKIGATVVLQIQSFYKGAKRTLKILAEVKRSSMSKNHFSIGVYFKDLSKGSRQFLKQFCGNEI